MSAPDPELADLAGKEVLITGGLGFIGSSLAAALVPLGARVTLLDSMVEECGGNLFNIEPVADRVQVNFCDIRDPNSMNWLVRGKDLVFHLAGQNSHILSLSDPFPDIDMNVKGTAVLLEACKHHAPEAKIVYSGTRGQYGKSVELPVGEDSPMNPLGIYEVTRLAAEKMIQVYNDVHGIRAVMLRLTNVYGPRSQMKHNRFGVVNWFVRQALDGETISVYGDGGFLRDFLYIDDCVDAMLRCAVSPKADGEIFNVGHDRPTSFLELIQEIVRLAGTGSYEHTPFSKERAAQEPGDFFSDIRKISRTLGWHPTISLEEGLRRTLDYYREHRGRYWTPGASA